MLYKNDEIYKLTAQDHKDIKQKFKKFPVTLKYPDHRITYIKSGHNKGQKLMPNSITFPLGAVRHTDTGSEHWRFCDSRIVDGRGNARYEPSNLSLKDRVSLTQKDVELIWWLWKICPCIEGGENRNKKKAKCVFEDLVGDANRKADREEKLATVKALIYSSQVGIGEKRLRQIAKAYFIPDVDELTFSQVKIAVEMKINRDKKKGMETFLDLVDAEQVLAVRSNIQQAIDNNLITYMKQKKLWAWVTEQGVKNDPIVQIASNSDPNEALYDYYMGNRKFAQSLIAALKGSKVVIPEGIDEPEGVPEPEV